MAEDTRSHQELKQQFQEEYNALRGKFRQKSSATESDKKSSEHALKAGQEFEQDPQPADAIDGMRLFKEYYSGQEFIVCKMIFNETVGVWNEHSVRSQLQKLDQFIHQASSQSYVDACHWINGATWELNHIQKDIPVDEFLYLLWTVQDGDFFRNFRYTNQYAFTGSRHAQIYGKYVLFHNFLKGQLPEPKEEKRVIKSAKKNKSNELRDYWKDTNQYEKVIEFLKEESPLAGGVFLKEIDKQLVWVKRDHYLQYLKGFVRICLDAGIMKDIGYAPHYQTVFNHTFNMQNGDDHFKAIMAVDIKQEYLDPFKPIFNLVKG